MPKIFSEQERSEIRASMLRIGAELLKSKGVRLVSVEEIAKKVNIAKGTFYSFYNSKEELLWDVIQLEKQRMADEILEIASQNVDSKTKVRRILQEVYLKDGSIVFCLSDLDLAHITRKLEPERMMTGGVQPLDINRIILTAWGAAASDKNVEILTAVLEALRFACTNQIPHGASAKKEVLDILADGIANYFCG